MNPNIVRTSGEEMIVTCVCVLVASDAVVWSADSERGDDRDKCGAAAGVTSGILVVLVVVLATLLASMLKADDRG